MAHKTRTGLKWQLLIICFFLSAMHDRAQTANDAPSQDAGSFQTFSKFDFVP